MKKIIAGLMLALFLLPTICFADGLPKVAIIPFNNQSPRQVVSDGEIDQIRDIIEIDIKQTGKFKAFTRTEIDKLLEEIKFDQSGLVDPATAAKYGKMIGAQYLVLGTITGLGTKTGSQYIANLSLRMIEVETAEIFLAGRGKGESKRSAFEALEKAAEDALTGKRGMLTMMR